MVMMSRTMGMLCRATRSAVSSEAAMAGRAEFFAPLTATEPHSALPPVIRNLSMSRFPERPAEVPVRPPEQPAGLARGHAALQHHQSHPDVVSGKPQSASALRQAPSAGLRQHAQGAAFQLLVGE